MREFLDSLKDWTPVISVITFGLGLYLGNKNAVNRDKRKEFNHVAIPIRIELIKYIESIEKNEYRDARIKQNDVIYLVDSLSKRKSKKLKLAFDEFFEASSLEKLESDCFGQRMRLHPSHIPKALNATKNLIDVLARK